MTEPQPPRDRKPADPLTFDVAKIATASALRVDPMLELLARMAADPGGPTPKVHFLTNGTVISGRLAADRYAAQVLDQSYLALLEKAREESAETETWDELIQQHEESGFFVQKDRDETERKNEFRDKFLDFVGNSRLTREELPPDMAREALRADSKAAVTLIDAQFFLHGAKYEIGLMRVRLADVGAWWVDPKQESRRSE